MTKSDHIRNRFHEVNDRLGDAWLQGNDRRVELLTYGGDMLAREYREAKANEVCDVFGMLGEAFSGYRFPSIRPAQ